MTFYINTDTKSHRDNIFVLQSILEKENSVLCASVFHFIYKSKKRYTSINI